MTSQNLNRLGLAAGLLAALGAGAQARPGPGASGLKPGPAKSVNAPRSFHRAGPSIDPVTGALAGADAPNTWNVELPAWAPNRGFRRVGGTNFIVGVSGNGQLYGTPDVLGQGALFISGDEGRTWSYRATLPHINAKDHIERITSLCFGAKEILFASMNQGGLFVSSNGFATCSPNVIPGWYRSVAPRTAFNGDLLVEAVIGRAAQDCRALACLYGQRLEGAQKLGSLCVFRTDVTLGQMGAGITPKLQLAWRQDAFDFYARHVAGAVGVPRRAGTVSATASTLTDAAGIFGAHSPERPRCARITSGAGAGQSRMICSNTPNTLALCAPWQAVPDESSDYEVIDGGVSGSGMHLHCAAWAPRSRNGESNVLFISFGDKTSGHVCRVANFDQLPPCGDEGNGSGLGWNYSDTQVFAINHQPTGMWAESGSLYFLARDYDGATMVTPDDVFNPQVVFCDSFAPWNSPYSGVNYDAWVCNRAAIVASLVERAAGQYGVFVGDAAGTQQMFRYVRGLRTAAASNYAGFSAVFGNAQNDEVAVTADSFGCGALTNTWLTHAPALMKVEAVLVANASVNLIPNAGFATNNGVIPAGWYAAAGSPAGSAILHAGGVYGGGDFWRITLTNAANLVQYNQRAVQSGFPAGPPLCASVAYRFPAAYDPAMTDGASFRVEWRDAERILRIDTVGGLQSVTTNQWRTASFRVVPPANAIQGRFSILCHNYTGAVDIAMPSATWNRFAAPANGCRDADTLEYDSMAADWEGCLNARAEFLVLPLWPTDLDPGQPETICSIESSDGARCVLTWDYTLGFQAVLENNLREPLLALNLGQLRALTRFDPCRFSLDFQRGRLTAKLDAGADVLQAAGMTTVIHCFKPIKIRLGSDMFSRGHPGWEGYYALLACQACN